MSGLLGGIINQSRSLSAQSMGLQIAGKNLSNVNNPNYSRQRVNIAATFYGAEATGISQVRNKLLDTQLLRQTSQQGSLNSQQSILNTLQSILGERIDTTSNTSNGLAGALDNFFNSFSALAANPSEAAQRQAVIAATNRLTDQLHYLSTSITNTDANVSSQITTQSASVQSLLSEIATLNGQIAQIEIANPGEALDLRDTRQAKLQELSSYINITVTNSSQGLGQIDISVPNTTGGSVTLVNATQVNGTFTYTGSGFTGGSPSTALSITSGSIAGYQTTRSSDITDLMSALNNISSQLVTTVNAAYGGNFFRVDSGNPLLYKTAADIQIDPSITSSNITAGTGGESGANNIALAIAALGNTSFTSGPFTGTFNNYYDAQVSDIGGRVNSLESQIESTALVTEMLEAQRQSEGGVSMDEESTNIITFQRAYQSNARVINIMDTLLEAVINLGR